VSTLRSANGTGVSDTIKRAFMRSVLNLENACQTAVVIEACALRYTSANQSLGIYYVHPQGREAIRRGVHERALVQWTPPLAEVPCIGESRRGLATTFGGDMLEYEKLMRFFV
jgi:hypothetical protein